jgi:hypothetical protein
MDIHTITGRVIGQLKTLGPASSKVLAHHLGRDDGFGHFTH